MLASGFGVVFTAAAEPVDVLDSADFGFGLGEDDAAVAAVAASLLLPPKMSSEERFSVRLSALMKEVRFEVVLLDGEDMLAALAEEVGFVAAVAVAAVAAVAVAVEDEDEEETVTVDRDVPVVGTDCLRYKCVSVCERERVCVCERVCVRVCVYACG